MGSALLRGGIAVSLEHRNDDNALREIEHFVAAHLQGCLMQSPRWALVKSNWGHQLLLSRKADGRLCGSMLILTLADRGGGSALLYAPRGPVCDPKDRDTITELIDGARMLAHSFSHGTFKCDPLIKASDSEAIAALTCAGLHFAAGARFGQASQPRQNAVRSDLAGLDEQTLLPLLSYNARYAIRQAQKAGIHCGPECSDRAFQDFFHFYLETGHRQCFSTRPPEYLHRLLCSFGKEACIFLCRAADGRPLAGAIAVAFGLRLSYLYAGSIRTPGDPGSGCLMQWELLRWALHSGCAFYDMGGICTDPQESSALYQLYQFKRKFAPEVSYAGEFSFSF